MIMVGISDLTPLLLGGAVIYVVTQSGILKGVSGAVEGLGEGISEAAGGLGSGISQIGRSTGQAFEDVQVLLFGVAGELGRQGAQIIELKGQLLRRDTAREFSQDEEVDIAAHEIAKDPLSEIQAGREVLTAEEKAERSKLFQEQLTQSTEFITSIDDKAISAFKKTGSGLLAFWRWSPLGLLQTFIQNVGSAGPTTSGSSMDDQISGGQTDAVVSSSEVITSSSQTNSSGGGGSTQLQSNLTGIFTSSGEQIGSSTQLTIVSDPDPTPTPSIFQRIGGFFRRFF